MVKETPGETSGAGVQPPEAGSRGRDTARLLRHGALHAILGVPRAHPLGSGCTAGGQDA